MRLVRQEDRSGCGIACVAMLVGVEYKTARAAWVGFSKRRARELITIGGGLRRGDLVAALIRLGAHPGLNQKIKMVNEQPVIGGHWVVDDDGHILDPEIP